MMLTTEYKTYVDSQKATISNKAITSKAIDFGMIPMQQVVRDDVQIATKHLSPKLAYHN